MAGRRDNVEHASAEIESRRVARPAVAHAEEGGDLFGFETDNIGVRPVAEFLVPGVVIAVPVRMGDDQANRVVAVGSLPLTDQSIDGRADLEPSGT